MKIIIYLLLLVCLSADGQTITPAPPLRPTPSPTLPQRSFDPYAALSSETPKLTKFNLDFPGGTPKQLVAAIEKATSRPLNVVIPDEYADEIIPALRMTQVTVQELFKAMELASNKTVPYRTSSYYGGGPGSSYSYQQMETSISFQTGGAVNDDCIWYFLGRQQPHDLLRLETKPAPEKICRVYALTAFLEQGIKVEDITTAIQTGWKMLGDKDAPTISFHKETKLLIAVGEIGKLEMIDTVLRALSMTSGAIDPATGLPVNSFETRLKSIMKRATEQPAPANPVPQNPGPVFSAPIKP